MTIHFNSMQKIFCATSPFAFHRKNTDLENHLFSFLLKKCPFKYNLLMYLQSRYQRNGEHLPSTNELFEKYNERRSVLSSSEKLSLCLKLSGAQNCCFMRLARLRRMRSPRITSTIVTTMKKCTLMHHKDVLICDSVFPYEK